MMKYFQKLGKALMLPVACLPICGILMGIGYAIAPGVMGVPEAATSGAVYMIGLFLVKAGGAVIDNMAILFAIGVGVGLSEDNDGTGGLAALVSWLIVTTLVGSAGTIAPSLAENPTWAVAYAKIANPFVGILAGIIGAVCYNKYKGTKLPDVLSFFSGKRSVAIVTGVVSIVVSAVLLFVWPVIFSILVAAGNAIAGTGYVGVGIYAFLNRLLIPTGLHHALNNVFWFDTIGMGDLVAYWYPQGDVARDASWSVGMYMAGFFPCMMFGIPGAALAMIQTAKSDKKKYVIGVVGSAALCSFLCGVTEPFEFAFMFLAFPLYVVYAALYGIFAAVTVALGFRAGFMFSAGAADLLFSSSLPAAAGTWLILPLGIAAFAVFYLVFLVAIKAWNLKTPGREDDDVETEKNAILSDSDFGRAAAVILEGLGGRENVKSLDNCITRLRLEVNDYTQVDEKKIKSAGVAGVIRPGKTAVQVIIGTKVQFVADEMKKLL